MTMVVCLAALLAVARAQEDDAANSRVDWIGLANGTEPEAVAAAELRALMRKYDLEPWIMTRRILIDENQLPNSGPPLTLNEAEIGDELGFLSDFVHEQLHWLEGASPRAFGAALADFEALFPDVPPFADGGAFDDRATYRHLLVCDLEYQAMTALVGEAAARETLAAIGYYKWIYDKVLNDPRIREIALRHGFNVSRGVPGP